MLRFCLIVVVCLAYTTNSWSQQFTLKSEPVKCNGQEDGKVIARISKSHSPYVLRLQLANNYRLVYELKERKDTSVTITGLVAGEYLARIISTDGLKDTLITIESAVPLKATIEILEEISKADSCSGSIKANVEGGTPPYTYEWSENTGNRTGQHISGLCEGIYRCVISDVHKCNKEIADVFLVRNKNE